MEGIEVAAKRMANKRAQRVTLFLIGFALLVFSVVLFVFIDRRVETAAYAVRGQLAHTIRLGDSFQMRSQLVALKDSEGVDAYSLGDKNGVPLVSGGQGLACEAKRWTLFGGRALCIEGASIYLLRSFPVAISGDQEIFLKTSKRLPLEYILLALFIQATLFWIILRVFADIFYRFSQTLTQPMRGLARLISVSQNNEGLELTDNYTTELKFREVGESFEAFMELMRKLKVETEQRKQAEYDSALAKLISQVAHDIRSPLAALEIITHTTPELPEDRRVLIRSAVGRIKDIASSLLKKHVRSEEGPATPLDSEVASPQLLSVLLESIVSEKRTEYRSRLGVEIALNLSEQAYGLFASVQPIAFRRVLSNLINNSVEALGAEGKITIDLRGSIDGVELRVIDNGCGMSADTLARVGERGWSFAKEGGSGLGLHHAKASVQAWRSSLQILSQVNEGTTVLMRFPRHASPAWFADELRFERSSLVVVVDDDATIHQIWQRRLAVFVESGVLRFESFSSPDALRDWLGEHEKPSSVTYLCDQEFLGINERGLDMIRDLGIATQSVLVTSHFEEKTLQLSCLREGLRMVPKGLAVYVPIVVSPPERAAFETAEPESVFLI